MRLEIRIAGTGGMGVVLAGVLFGHAAAVHGGMNVVQSQSYGSEARGTAAKSEVILSDEEVHYPKVRKSDILIAMSQKALDMYITDAKKGSVVIVDPDLVDTSAVKKDYTFIEVPAMQTADQMGLRLVSNMVMLGALTKKAGVFPLDALKAAIMEMVAEKYHEKNIEAITKGANLV